MTWRSGTLLPPKAPPAVAGKSRATGREGATEPLGQTSTRLGTPLIAVAGLSKTFPGSQEPAVDSLSFAVNAGETLAILGPSGSGKTTVLRLLAGFEALDGGEISLGERVVASTTDWVPPEKRGLGMVFQQFALFPHLTAIENVTYGFRRMGSQEKRRRAQGMLEMLGMGDLAARYPHQLSGGQQQRVALARALAPGPLVLLMDEPFGSLDADMRSQMRREVKGLLRGLGATAILVTHDQEEAFLLADRILILQRGRLQQLNTPDNIYHRPINRFVARFVGMADFLPALPQAHQILTELGAFPFEGAAPGGKVELLVRPDDIAIRPDAAGEAVIVSREFKGSDNLYSVRLPSGLMVRAVQPSEPVYHLGERVRVKATLKHVILFPGREE